MPIGPPGTRHYWGFRARLSRQTDGPYCEVQYCAESGCTYFIIGEALKPLSSNGQWQKVVSAGTEVPTPNPPTTPIPYARIACFGYGEAAGPDVYFDRFFFSTQPIGF